MGVKASILKGTRDFGPSEVRKREYILEVIREVYQLYGFQPLETPAMEKLETLTGKYGDEGDQLLFKVLNNGDFLNKVNSGDLESKDSKAVSFQISKRGLRYDLTVPFARYVAMNQSDLAFPFKRYQIQTVWRGDRPQRGRYQEFVQCDADIIGTSSLWPDAEFLMILDEVFFRLGLKAKIHLNNRKVLEGLAVAFGLEDQLGAFTTLIDKWDKIGKDRVSSELDDLMPTRQDASMLMDLLDTVDLDKIKEMDNDLLRLGIEELETVLAKSKIHGFRNELMVDLKLARGLSYYTGSIIEVTIPGSGIGSVSGGGRYDDLTGVFGLRGSSGMGISFGLARIYEVMEAQGLFPQEVSQDLDLLFLAMDEDSLDYCFRCAHELRHRGGQKIEVYPEVNKFKKLMKFADRRGVQQIAIVGQQERESDTLTIKNMQSGEQKVVKREDLLG